MADTKPWLDTSSSWSAVRGDSIEDVLAKLTVHDPEKLAALIVNDRLNEFIIDLADYNPDDADPHGHGKRIPYIGWYWRNTQWVERRIPIGDCGDFIGIIENNKWGYPERYLTDAEANQVIEVVWAAYSGKRDEAAATLDKLWGLFQSFQVGGGEGGSDG